MATVADPRRRVGDRVEDLLQGGPYGSRRLALSSPGGNAGCLCQSVEVIAFGLIEVQRRGQRVQHTIRGAGEVAPLHSHVVVHRHPSQPRDLFAAQTLDPAVTTISRQARLLGRYSGAPRTEELPDRGAQIQRVHELHGKGPASAAGGTGDTWYGRHSQPADRLPIAEA